MAGTYENVVLIDAEGAKKYSLVISSDNAKKLNTDVTFSMALLKHAKQTQHVNNTAIIEDVVGSSSTSSNAGHGEKAKEVSKTDAGGSFQTDDSSSEGTHIWSKAETLLLLNLYEDYKEEYHSGKGTVKQFWNKIALGINAQGYNLSGTKCATKFQALKRTYKIVSDANKKSGNSRKDWEYFKIMNDMFGDKPWMNPLSVAGSMVEEEEDLQNTIDKEPERDSIKRKLHPYLKEHIQNSQEAKKKSRDLREQDHKEKLTALGRLEELLVKSLKGKDS